MRFPLIALVVFMAAGRCFAADPLDFVKKFYGEAHALGVGGFSDEKAMAGVRPMLTDELNACFTEAQKAVAARLEKELHKEPEYQEVEIDGKKQRVPLPRKFVLGRLRVFTDSGEGVEYLGLGASSVSSSRAYVQVKMKLPGEELRWTDLLILHLTESGWKVDDILFATDGEDFLATGLRHGLASTIALANDAKAWGE